jgi:hypothetical protein
MQPKKNKIIFFFFEIWQVFSFQKKREYATEYSLLFFHVFCILWERKKKASWQDQHFLLIIEKDRSLVPSVGATKMAGPPETRLLT